MNSETAGPWRGRARRLFWVEAAVFVALLCVALLGVTQALILLAVYAVIILPA